MLLIYYFFRNIRSASETQNNGTLANEILFFHNLANFEAFKLTITFSALLHFEMLHCYSLSTVRLSNVFYYT